MAYEVTISHYEDNKKESVTVYVPADRFRVMHPSSASFDAVLEFYRDDEVLMAAFSSWDYVMEWFPDAQ